MPVQLSAGDRKLLLIAGGAFVAIVTLTLLFANGRGKNKDETPTTYSVSSGGAKAAYLLLKSSGREVERWEQPPSELPQGANDVYILAEPYGSPTTEERKQLREYVAKGGHVVAAGPFVGLFLPQHSIDPDPIEGMAWKKFSALSPSSITRAAPQITLAPKAYWKTDLFALPLYGEGDKPRVVKYRFGKGEVVWWASATPLTNAGLKESGNLEFFLACLGPDAKARILWDEYFHGHRRSLAASIRSSPVKWILFQCALFALAILLTYSRRSGPITIPAAETRLSPLEFVRTLGALYKQADAASVAVDISYKRFRYWTTRRLGLTNNASVDELDRAIRERWNFHDEKFAATLRACESAIYDNTLKPRSALALVASLDDYAAKLQLFSKTAKEKN